VLGLDGAEIARLEREGVIAGEIVVAGD
jgi:hypothetical protein